MKRIIAIILSLLIFFSSILVNVIVKDVCSVAKEQMNVVDVQMDGHGSAALLSNGELYFWGEYYTDEGYEDNRYFPEKIMADVRTFAFKESVCAVIKNNGDLYTWGETYFNILGHETHGIDYCTPKKILENIVDVKIIGLDTCIALSENGEVYTWGDGKYGSLGNGTTETCMLPQKIMDGVKSIEVDGFTVTALKDDDSLYAWGSGNLGLKKDENMNTLSPVYIMDGIKKAKVSKNNGWAISVSGSLYVWGKEVKNMSWTELSSAGFINLDSEKMYSPQKFKDNVIDAELFSGNDHFYMVQCDDGKLYIGGWWRNKSYYGAPHLLKEDVKSFKITNGGSALSVITQDNKLFLLGYYPEVDLDMDIEGVEFMDDVSTYIRYPFVSAVIKTNGDLYMWGDNYSGQCGTSICSWENPDSNGNTWITEPIKLDFAGTGNSSAELDKDLSNYTEAKTVGTVGELYQKESGLGKISLSCDETVFSQNATTYHHDLATFAAGMSTMIYNESKDATGNNNKNMEDALNALGYKEIKEVADKVEDKAPYCLAYKTVVLDGKKTNILCVVVRGTYKKEWIDNFDSGYGESTHKGFLRGSDFVYNGICDYVKDNKLSDGKLKILITGHSRGAAVANLLGAKIDDNSLKNSNFSLSISNKDVFVYTFATPNTTSIKERDDPKYNNIYNIVNPEDFVTKVMPSKWGYGRYGKSYVLPSKSTDLYTDNVDDYVDYISYVRKLKKYYKEYRPKDKDGYAPYIKGMVDVSEYVSTITNTVPNSQKYYTKNLHNNTDYGIIDTSYSLQALFTKTLGYFMSQNNSYRKSSYLYMADALSGLYWGKIGQKTISFFVVHQGLGMLPVLTESFACAHRSETYLAAMNILTEKQLKQGRSTMKGIVNCPVDITIKNNEGDVLGQIEKNEINESVGDEIIMNVDGDSKSFYLPTGQDFTIELTGNDEGEMDYSLCEIDADTGETNRVSYQAVDIEKGKTLTQIISADSSVDQINLCSEDKRDIKPTLIYGTDDYGVDIDIVVEGIGSVDSYSDVRLGDYIKLEAVTDENNDFIGFYDEAGTLVSDQPDYAFSVQGSKRLIARFTSNVVDIENVTFEASSVEMQVGDEDIFTATVNPSNATNKRLTYSSTNNDVAKVEECGIISAISEGTAKITAVTEDGKHEAIMYIVVKRTDGDAIDDDKTSTVPLTATSKPQNKPAENIQKKKITKPSKITNVKLKNKKSKKIFVSWKKKAGASGYQIQYALNKKFTKKKKSVNATKNKYSKTIIGLKKKKTYYVRVRGFKSYKGKKYYGKWSSVKKIKIKR